MSSSSDSEESSSSDSEESSSSDSEEASSSDSEEASSSESEGSSTESVSLALVAEEMTEAIATLRDTAGDVSAVTHNDDILETKIFDLYHVYETKSQRLYLGDHLATIGAAQVFTENIQWLRGMEHGGFSEDVSTYLLRLYACCMNYTDCSKKFAEELGKAKITPVLVQNLQEFAETWTTNTIQEEIVTSSLVILYNMSRFSNLRPLFKENNAIGSLIPYLKTKNKILKTVATFTLAYVIDEKNLGTVADPSVIRFIIQVFTEAVDDEMKRCDGFSATELAMGIEGLAANDTPNDDNKLALVAKGILPPLIKLMTEGDEEEQLHAIRAINQLAFHPSNREKIRQLKVIPLLKKCERSKNSASVIAARGALWELGDAEARKQKVETPDAKKASRAGHVMLSYQWDNQKVVKKIKKTLDAKGYKVWMDIDKMGGSIFDSMAGAVEGAVVVLVCMSRKYKLSANCRRGRYALEVLRFHTPKKLGCAPLTSCMTCVKSLQLFTEKKKISYQHVYVSMPSVLLLTTECEYAVTRGTDIIPLKMENKYQPDGWLGITVGSSLYFNFDDKDSFDKVMTRLMKEMGDRGKGHTAAGAEVDTVDSKLEGLKLHDWTQEDVKRWIKENQLEGKLKKLKPEDLHSLHKMKKEAPVEFCKSIEDDLGLKSISSKRKFCDALDKLEKAEQPQTFRDDKSVVKGSSSCQII
ncbi:uncharacterized protein LOC144884637 [Branchiostoma floridae x Branchiostoma japonicum]